MQQQRRLARSRRTLTRRGEDPDNHAAAPEARQHIARREGAIDRVELVSCLRQSGRGGEIHVSPERDYYHVALKPSRVGLHAPGDRINRLNGRLNELHPRLDDVAIRMPDP
jgi:hypothetical protein